MAIDNETNPVIGFDLGTTFSALARWVDRKGPQIIQNRAGQDTTQSAVYFNPENDEILVGNTAYNRGLMTPENMIVGVKRLMDDGHQKIMLGGKEFTPISLSSLILEKIYEDAKMKYPTGTFSSRGSVVTVPCYFKAHQMDNTRQAAEMADINCIGIIQEPIAASLTYALQICEDHFDKEFNQKILVFDLGGGTFDLTLFQLNHTNDTIYFEVLASSGDDRLGGMDFDQCLADVILEKSGVSLDGVEPKLFNKAQKNLLEQSTLAKIALSASNDYYVAVPFILPDKHIEVSITREDFEKCIKNYLDKISIIIDGIWASSNLTASDIDRVIRVGGSSQIPCIKNLLDDILGAEKTWSNINPSTSIAEGAAMYAAYLDNTDFFEKKIVIRTRTCHALGLKTAGERFKELIPANREAPCTAKQVFTTTKDNVKKLNLSVYQGSGRKVSKKTHSLIGKIPIKNIAPKRAGEIDIVVMFSIDMAQRLSIEVEVEGQKETAVVEYT
ncbi:Hsp70 family protein [bacterium]|nr:Hsp70 family protein [bacterium]